jgi:hypothetical protein
MGGDHLWEEIGAIGQVLGSVAVFITLGYLALQLRHARTEMQRSFTQTRAAMVRDQAMGVATDEGLSHLVAKANIALGGVPAPFVTEVVKRTGLTDEEATRVFLHELAWSQMRVVTILNIEYLPDSVRGDFEKRFRSQLAQSPVTRLFYETGGGDLGPNLMRYIDNLLAQPA